MIAGVRFRKACKVYDFDVNGQEIVPGDTVIVEVERGLGMGVVASGPKEMESGQGNQKLKRIIRKADDVDLERQSFNKERNEEALKFCKEKIVDYKLDMRLIRVDYLFDSSKAVFYFTSEERVDFRSLVKDLAARFHTRIEMRQIGVRDEAKVIGGLGPCGRELCCSNFISNFAPVTVKMAKEQGLALNPAKISGVCGRLMCCLAYEHGAYKERSCKKSAPCGKPGPAPDGVAASGEAPARAGGGKRPERRRDERRGEEKPGWRERRKDRGGGAGSQERPASEAGGASPAGTETAGEGDKPTQERREPKGRRRSRRRRGSRGGARRGQGASGSAGRSGGSKPEGGSGGGGGGNK